MDKREIHIPLFFIFIRESVATMLPPSAFEHLDVETLKHIILDCQNRIDSNPNHQEYVQQQETFILQAYRTLEKKEGDS